MSSRRAGVVLLLLVALLASLLVVSGFSPPPVYEHKAERNHRGTQCEACQAVVKQALRRMPKGYSEPDLSTQKLRRAREQKVSDAVENLCTTDSFARYEYSPPNMVTACNSFLADQGESLEQLLYTGVPDRDIRTRLCIEDSGVCSSLWSDEDEERKRDRSPEESEREAAEQKRAGREAAKAEKARKKAEKAEKARKAKEAKAKKAKKASAPVPDRDQNEPKEEL